MDGLCIYNLKTLQKVDVEVEVGSGAPRSGNVHKRVPVD